MNPLAISPFSASYSLLSALYFGIGVAHAAVVDPFRGAPQILNLDSSSKHIAEVVSLSDSPFTSRAASLSGGAQSLSIGDESRWATYTFALGDTSVGQFSLTYATEKGASADLMSGGETGFLFRFDHIQLRAPVGIVVGYYSTQWKGSAEFTLVGNQVSEEVFLPFSAFPAKAGDFGRLTSLSVTSRSLQPGDRLGFGPITTVPEATTPMLIAFAAAMMSTRRRRSA